MPGPSLVRSAGIVSAFTLLSRVLGFARDAVAAHFFAVGGVWDAFALAFRVPNLFRRLFGEGALTSAFLPAFVERYEGGRPADAHALLNKVATLLGLLLTVLATAGAGFAWLMPAIWPDDPKVALEAPLIRIMMPYLPLICMAAMLGAALHGMRHYVAPAFAPVLLNLVWIGALFVFPGNIAAVAWAVVVGGLLELLIMVPPLARRGMMPRPSLGLRDPGVRQVGSTFLPIVFGLAPVQINELVGSILAQHLIPGKGAVSALYYGNQLVQLPLALIGTAVAVVVFPLFASPKEDFQDVLRRALRLVLFLSVPATVGLIVLAEPIVALLFQHGRFTADDTRRVAWIVVLYAAGLWAYCANQVQVRAFYARKDTTAPVRVSATMVLLNLGVTLSLIWTLAEKGIAIANTATGLATFVALNVLLRRRHGSPDLGPVYATLAKSAVASLVMGAAAWGAWRGLSGVVQADTIAAKGVRALVPVAAGIVTYLLAARGLGMDEARLLRRRRPS